MGSLWRRTYSKGMDRQSTDLPGEVNWTEVAETTLIEQGQQGNRDAIAELVRRHYKVSTYVARSILRDNQEAEDAVQSAYCKAIQHLGRFRREARFGTWITRIVMNQCIARLRSLRMSRSGLEKLVRTSEFTSFISRELTPEEIAEDREAALLLHRAVVNLPLPLRQACQLGLQGLSARDVAARLRINESTAKVRQFRARAALRSQLQAFRPHG